MAEYGKLISPLCMSVTSKGEFYLTGTSPEDDYHKDITRAEARKILIERGCTQPLLDEIMDRREPGVVMC